MSIIPKTSKKLKLLEFDALEVARQLTMIECHLYMKIRPSECLMRSREQKSDNNDNIAAIIVTTNKVYPVLRLVYNSPYLNICVSQIAHWVADTVLSKDDSRKRAMIVKQFISVADVSKRIDFIPAWSNSPPSAMSRAQELLKHDRHRFWLKFTSHPSAKANLGTNYPKVHDNVGSLRNDDRFEQELQQLSVIITTDYAPLCSIHRYEMRLLQACVVVILTMWNRTIPDDVDIHSRWRSQQHWNARQLQETTKSGRGHRGDPEVAIQTIQFCKSRPHP